jgi:hypothetical protein
MRSSPATPAYSVQRFVRGSEADVLHSAVEFAHLAFDIRIARVGQGKARGLYMYSEHGEPDLGLHEMLEGLGAIVRVETLLAAFHLFLQVLGMSLGIAQVYARGESQLMALSPGLS